MKLTLSIKAEYTDGSDTSSSIEGQLEDIPSSELQGLLEKMFNELKENQINDNKTW